MPGVVGLADGCAAVGDGEAVPHPLGLTGLGADVAVAVGTGTGVAAFPLAGAATALALAVGRGTGLALALATGTGFALAVATGTGVAQDGVVGVADALAVAVADGLAVGAAGAAEGLADLLTWAASVPAVAADAHPASSATPVTAPSAQAAVPRFLRVETFICSSS